jgi:glycosyltransferase involved in cell wall biosynthesis
MLIADYSVNLTALNMTKMPVITILMPCYNEGKSICSFLDRVTEVTGMEKEFSFNILVIDDCSLDNSLDELRSYQCKAENASLHIISNFFNSGHQASIYQGLLYTAKLDQDFVIIMDSDGEDDPAAIPLLLRNMNYDIVEVKRKKRSEGILFRVLYSFYKIFFRLITGKIMNYGNYCMLRNSVVEKIRHTSFIHLPAYLLKQQGKRAYISYNRSVRMEGKSKMGYKELFIHAFKSFVEFGNDLLLWFLRLFGLVFIGLVAISLNLFYQKFISHTAIPGWFSTLFIGLLNLAMLCMGFFVLGILLINMMHHRNNSQAPVYRIISGEVK